MRPKNRTKEIRERDDRKKRKARKDGEEKADLI
jgi:hypothetical protein